MPSAHYSADELTDLLGLYDLELLGLVDAGVLQCVDRFMASGRG